MQKFPWIAAPLSLAFVTLAGCGFATEHTPVTTPSTDYTEVTSGAALATSSDMNAMATSLTDAQISDDGGSSASADVARPDKIAGCPAVDIKSTGPDGNWTDKLLTFTNPPCIVTGRRGYDSLAITGMIELTRMANQDQTLSLTSDTTNLEWAFTKGTTTYSETRNGTRVVTAGANFLNIGNNITIDYAGSKYDGTLMHALSSNFTPVAGSTLAVGEPLPSGTFTVSGISNWSSTDGKSGTFNVATVTPLAYDAACKDASASVFSAGQLTLTLADTAKAGTATVTWSDCAAPTIVYTAATS